MFMCINCGKEVKELYRQYSPSVLKILKCENCGEIADKYIEYDPVIVLIDIVLLEKPAYRHLLYNGNFKSYWKLMIILLLSESYRNWFALNAELESLNENQVESVGLYEKELNFYFVLLKTALSLVIFAGTVIGATEFKWRLLGKRPSRYQVRDLIRALIVAGCAKLLGLLGIIWQKMSPMLYYTLIHGYTVLCLLTAYAVVCESGRASSLIGLSGGLLAYNYIYKNVATILMNLFAVPFG